jgi:hypothetical protein
LRDQYQPTPPTLTAETERPIRLLDVKMQNTYCIMATNKLKQIINSASQTNVLQKGQIHVKFDVFHPEVFTEYIG